MNEKEQLERLETLMAEAWTITYRLKEKREKGPERDLLLDISLSIGATENRLREYRRHYHK